MTRILEEVLGRSDTTPGNTGCSAAEPMRGDPIPWKASEITPNLGNSPDTTDDMRGGMGLEGLVNVAKFIDEGGLFITITTNASIPVDYGLIEGVTIVPTRELQARGSVLNATIADKRSPIAYGYGDKLAVYFSQAPVLQVSMLGGAGGFGGGGFNPGGEAQSGRPTGRGTTTDPDIAQGRPYVARGRHCLAEKASVGQARSWEPYGQVLPTPCVEYFSAVTHYALELLFRTCEKFGDYESRERARRDRPENLNTGVREQ